MRMSADEKKTKEGVIKFFSHWKEAPAIFGPEMDQIVECRNQLFKLGLIGFDEKENVGYGNISVRIPGTGRFIISGTQTGHIAEAGPEHFSLVNFYDLEKNQVACTGPVEASSESMTHAVLYHLSEGINGIIHVHHNGIWKALWDVVPATGESIEYGTMSMVREVVKLFYREGLEKKQIFIMKGHDGGVVTFGATLPEAAEKLMHFFEPFRN